MREYLPVLIVGAVIGVFAVVFLVAFFLQKDRKASMGWERHMGDKEIVRRLHEKGVMRLRQLFSESRSRTELVATFVAVLELCKAGRVGLGGDEDDLVVACTESELTGDQNDGHS